MKPDATNHGLDEQGKGVKPGAPNHRLDEQGKIGWALAWLLGVPLPLLLIIYLFTRAC